MGTDEEPERGCFGLRCFCNMRSLSQCGCKIEIASICTRLWERPYFLSRAVSLVLCRRLLHVPLWGLLIVFMPHPIFRAHETAYRLSLVCLPLDS